MDGGKIKGKLLVNLGRILAVKILKLYILMLIDYILYPNSLPCLRKRKINGETKKLLFMTLIVTFLAVLAMYICITDLTLEKNMAKIIMKMIRFVFSDDIRRIDDEA